MNFYKLPALWSEYRVRDWCGGGSWKPPCCFSIWDQYRKPPESFSPGWRDQLAGPAGVRQVRSVVQPPGRTDAFSYSYSRDVGSNTVLYGMRTRLISQIRVPQSLPTSLWFVVKQPQTRMQEETKSDLSRYQCG